MPYQDADLETQTQARFIWWDGIKWNKGLAPVLFDAEDSPDWTKIPRLLYHTVQRKTYPDNYLCKSTVSLHELDATLSRVLIVTDLWSDEGPLIYLDVYTEDKKIHVGMQTSPLGDAYDMVITNHPFTALDFMRDLKLSLAGMSSQRERLPISEAISNFQTLFNEAVTSHTEVTSHVSE